MLGADRQDDLTQGRPTVWDDTTNALRARSPEQLRFGLLAMVRGKAGDDQRDLMMAMAPYHHCAGQLGLDPALLFDDVASELPPRTAELVRGFGDRRDIRPRSFGFALEEDDGGPFYRPAP